VVEVPEELDVDESGAREHSDQPMPLVLINPDIQSKSAEDWTLEEGCLSFPGISAQIKRPAKITVSFARLDGTSVTAEFKGYLARVVQHEVDHLNGVLITDHMSPVKKAALSGRLKRMRKETQARLGIA
jgi:peptide deformylase